jgi:TrmH family RNA methyltransferase
MTIYVICKEISNSGNVGAIARAMANFDLKNLILVNPLVDHLCSEARNRAKNAQDVLVKAKVVSKIPKIDYIIATTAITGERYNPRSPLTPKQLAQIIPKSGKIGLMLGPESSGLTKEEILKADFVVTIPASKKYGTLNVSHAASILFYELFKADENIHELASLKDKEVLSDYINKIIDKMEFPTAGKKETQRIVWKRLLGKSFLTKREAFVLMGFFKRVK